MIFSFDITTPKNTPPETPLKTVLDITKGVIHHWIIFFPPGHWGECRVRVRRGSDYILPINPESFISGDNFKFSGDDFIYIRSEPYKLDVYTWNIDPQFEHTIYIQIFIKPLWTFHPMSDHMLLLLEQEETGLII